MAFVGLCRKIPISPCRQKRLQEIVVNQYSRELTPKLTRERNVGLNLEDLRRNASDIIKGLVVIPEFEVDSCPLAEPLIIFGKPVLAGWRADFQHKDIAAKLGLVRSLKVEFDGETQYEKRFAPGVWGFAMTPLKISSADWVDQTTVNYANDGSQQFTLRVNEKTYADLFDKESGTISNGALSNVSSETAVKLLQEGCVGFVIDGQKSRSDEIWAVIAASGFAGAIPKDRRDQFLSALAKHIAPDYKLLRFFADTNPAGAIIDVAPEQAANPNCLYWPIA